MTVIVTNVMVLKWVGMWGATGELGGLSTIFVFYSGSRTTVSFGSSWGVWPLLYGPFFYLGLES